MTLKLDRPLAVIDLETTSADVETARIVQIGIVFMLPGGAVRGPGYHFESVQLRLNPGMPISPEASALHGITDDMVKDDPKFADVAEDIWSDLRVCDLAGFNIERFDLPILRREFEQCEIDFPGPGCRVIDAMTIFHRKEKRDLSAAARLYLGRDHVNAHGALDDAAVTAEILREQVERYDLPKDAAGLEAYCHEKPAEYVDQDGKLVWRADGEAVFAFGKIKGKTLAEAAKTESGFLRWMLDRDFSPEVKGIVSAALEGRFPTAPAAKGAA